MKDVVRAECTSKKDLNAALAGYMMEYQFVSEDYLPLVMDDFEDPYSCPWIFQDYIGEHEVDGKMYEVRACWTDFSEFPSFDNAFRFRFYMLMHLKNPDDTTTWAYQKAEKLYVLEPIDEEDFPC